MSHLALVVFFPLVGENRADQHSRILDHHLTRGDIASAKQATPVNWRPWLKEKEEDFRLLNPCCSLSNLWIPEQQSSKKGRNFAKTIFIDILLPFHVYSALLQVSMNRTMNLLW